MDNESITGDMILPVPTRTGSSDDINSDLDREFLASQSKSYTDVQHIVFDKFSNDFYCLSLV